MLYYLQVLLVRDMYRVCIDSEESIPARLKLSITKFFIEFCVQYVVEPGVSGLPGLLERRRGPSLHLCVWCREHNAPPVVLVSVAARLLTLPSSWAHIYERQTFATSSKEDAFCFTFQQVGKIGPLFGSSVGR